MRATRWRALMTGLACAYAAVACGGVADKDEAVDNAGSGEDVGQIKPAAPPVSWEKFKAAAYQEPWPGGHYLVDGDVPLRDEAALRAYYDSWHDEGANYLTVNQVFSTDDIWPSPPRVHLTYCIGSSVGTNKAAVQIAMGQATSSWNDLVGIHFTYVPGEDATCTSSNTNVAFDVQQVPDDGIFAASFYPSDARASRSLNIRPAAYTTNQGGRDFQGILRHELGHTLGFRHEHIWLVPQCTGTTEAASNARQVTAYDVNSVMHYPQCRPSGTGGYRQTLLDYNGAISLYGLSAQLITSIVD